MYFKRVFLHLLPIFKLVCKKVLQRLLLVPFIKNDQICTKIGWKMNKKKHCLTYAHFQNRQPSIRVTFQSIAISYTWVPRFLWLLGKSQWSVSSAHQAQARDNFVLSSTISRAPLVISKKM